MAMSRFSLTVASLFGDFGPKIHPKGLVSSKRLQISVVMGKHVSVQR